MNAKYMLFLFAGLFIFTEGLIFLHNSSFEKKEFDRICNSIYTEKVWIDTCYLPYKQEINTFNLLRNAEIAGILATGAIFASKRLQTTKKAR